MTSHLIIGDKGEVGSALMKLIRKTNNKVEGIDLQNLHPKETTGTEFDFLHITIPFSERFIEVVEGYLRAYTCPKTICIVHSTVLPGTTKILSKKFPRIAYSPVRGQHPNMMRGMMFFQKFFAIATEQSSLLSPIKQMFDSIGIFSVPLICNPKSLEVAKLLNTMIHFARVNLVQEIYMIAEQNQLSLDIITQFVNSTLDRKLLPYAQCVGQIEHDHCLKPNVEILTAFTPLATFLLERNLLFGEKYNADEKLLQGSFETTED